jgi:hypothetical protein
MEKNKMFSFEILINQIVIGVIVSTALTIVSIGLLGIAKR